MGTYGSSPPSCCNKSKVDNACLKSELFLNGRVSLTDLLREIHHLFLKLKVFLCGQMVSVIFIRKSIPSSTKIFVSMIFNHSITEFMISYESVMDSLELSLFAFLLDLVSQKIFSVSWKFPMSVAVNSSFLDDLFWK